jgi:hypothetical protein
MTFDAHMVCVYMMIFHEEASRLQNSVDEQNIVRFFYNPKQCDQSSKDITT